MIEKEGETQDRHYAASLKKKKVLATKFINNERGTPQPSETNNLKRRGQKRRSRQDQNETLEVSNK